MLFDDLLNNPAKWMVESRDEHDIVLTSRIRLARNLTATPFPGWATRQQREETLKLTSGEARQIPVMKGGYYAELSGLTQQQKQLLVERHLISRELAARSEGCAVLISRSQNASILFNEEDHLRLQYILPGIQLKKAWGAISKIDSELEARLPYAYNTRLGYITACPTNLGTGMRASVMMHLPGLVISEQMQQVVQAAAQLNITVRGLYGEGTEATGNLFQISNQSTLGDSEDQIVERMTRFTSDLAHPGMERTQAAAPVIFPAGEGPRFPRLRPSDQCHSAFHAGGAGPALLPPDGSVSGHLFPPGIKKRQ